MKLKAAFIIQNLAILLITCLNTVMCYCQESMFFERFGPETGYFIKHGLSTTNYEGYMWFGSHNGLYKFDGYEITTLRPNGKNGSISDGMVRALLVCSNNDFLIGTAHGLNYYNSQHSSFIGFDKKNKTQSTLDNEVILKLLEDNNGNIWILTETSGIFRFNLKTHKIDHYFKENKSFIDITFDNTQQLWAVDNNTVYKFDTNTQNFKKILTNEKAFSGTITAMAFDLKKRLWLGTYEKGIYIFITDPEEIKLDNHLLATPNKSSYSLKNNSVTRLFCDKIGRIWIGYYKNGLSVWSPQNAKLLHTQESEETPDSLPDGKVESIYEDAQSNIWIGIWGGGFNKFDKSLLTFKSISQKNGLNNNMASSIINIQDDLFIGTISGGLAKYSKTKHFAKSFLSTPAQKDIPEQIYSMDYDQQSTIWIASTRGLYSFDIKTEKFRYFSNKDNRLKAYYDVVFIKSLNEVWIGGAGGMQRFSLKEQKWLTWDNLTAIKKITNHLIITFYKDSQQNVWIGTDVNNLFKYEFNTHKLYSYKNIIDFICPNIRDILEVNGTIWVGTDCGLLSINMRNNTLNNIHKILPESTDNTIYAILDDAQGFLWLTTNSGIMKFDPHTSQIIKHYTKSDGLLINIFNSKASCKYPDGTLSFGGVRGVVYFNPSEIQTNKFVAPTIISKIKTPKQTINIKVDAQRIDLAPNENFFEISFANLNFSNTTKNTYQYRLKGIDKQWVQAQNYNKCNYTNIPDGVYTFEVIGNNSDGIPSPKPAQLIIIIHPYYYQTWWFKAIIASLTLIAIGLLIRSYLTNHKLKLNLLKEQLQTKQQEEAFKTIEADLKNRVLNIELEALRSQINPHFIFNCLNSIKLYFMDNQEQKGLAHLNTFAKYVRHTVEYSASEKISLKKELEALKLYIELEKMRFKEKLSYKITIDPSIDVDKINVPHFLLQPIVENSIWHGIMPKEVGGDIQIIVTNLNDNEVLVKIIDNGIGREQAIGLKEKHRISSKTNTFGFKTTEERLRLFNQMYNIPISVVTVDLKNQTTSGGTKVIIKIPIIR